MLLILLLLSACDDMSTQVRQGTYTPLPPAALPAGTVPFEARATPAPPLTLALLQRGQERYHIYCAPCHADSGDGHGMVVQRGFPAPPTLHSAALRAAPLPQLYQVITRGYGLMYAFADRIEPDDRWAIVAYIRALQRSQEATAADLERAP
jgi:mono/diheme cytochrome c family protein